MPTDWPLFFRQGTENRIIFFLGVMKNVANKSFKIIKLTSCICSRGFHTTNQWNSILCPKMHMYLSQNNASKLNSCPHLFEIQRKIPSAINFKFKHWRLCLLLGTFTGAWCDSMCAWSMTSYRLANQSRTNVTWWSHDDVTSLQKL